MLKARRRGAAENWSAPADGRESVASHARRLAIACILHGKRTSGLLELSMGGSSTSLNVGHMTADDDVASDGIPDGGDSWSASNAAPQPLKVLVVDDQETNVRV